jgi:hypothetical protein
MRPGQVGFEIHSFRRRLIGNERGDLRISARREAMAEQIRQILIDEQDHQIDLATALGEDPPDLNAAKSTKSS